MVGIGVSVADALNDAGVWVDLPCGGAGTCGGCRVMVRGEVSPPTSRELQSLTADALKVGWRLACQARLAGDLEVFLPKGQNALVSDRMPSIKPAEDLNLGLAIDLGTTTIVGRVYDLSDQRMLAEAMLVNPQVTLGSDLITRIQRALEPDGKKRLQDMAVQGITGLVETLSQRLGCQSRQIQRMTIAGNPVMHHMLLGLHLDDLSVFPFHPVSTTAVTMTGYELGLNIAKDAPVYLFPLVDGFVGGDAVAGVVSTELQIGSGARLLMDLGTNGEVLLANVGGIWAASTAAGPAFEGGEIGWGMRAEPGAIIDLDIDKGWKVRTIHDDPPRGIAGSGLIRVVDELLKAGFLRADGRLKTYLELSEQEKALAGDRLRQGTQGVEVLLDRERQIVLTQRDIRQLQLAKGAIRSAVETLLNIAGIDPAVLTEVYIAGAFGSHIHPESLLRIGLLPEIAANKLRPVQNSALEGAAMALFSTEVRAEAERVADRIKHVSLENDENYQDTFVKALGFPG